MTKLSALAAAPGGIQPGDFTYIVRSDGASPETFANYKGTVDKLLTKAIIIAVTDETTAITGTGRQITFRMPFAMTLTEVRASLTDPDSANSIVVDINEGVSSVLSTKITIDQGDTTSVGAGIPPVISDASLADNAEISIDIDTTGTDATGLKVTLIGVPA